MSTWKPIEFVEIEDHPAFPIAPGDALGGPIYRFLAYVPTDVDASLVLAAMSVWGLPMKLIVQPLPADWPADDQRLVAETARTQGRIVTTVLPGPNYRAVRGEFVGQTMRFATKVPLEAAPGERGMYPYQVWRGPDVRFGQAPSLPAPTPMPTPPKPEPTSPAVPPPEFTPTTETKSSISSIVVGTLVVGAAAGVAAALYMRGRQQPTQQLARESLHDISARVQARLRVGRKFAEQYNGRPVDAPMPRGYRGLLHLETDGKRWRITDIDPHGTPIGHHYVEDYAEGIRHLVLDGADLSKATVLKTPSVINPNCDLSTLSLTEVTEQDTLFKTGFPVTFRYVRNTGKAGNYGETYQQHIEPAGRFMLHNADPGQLARDWETGFISFQSPLVLALSTDDHIYGPNSWKARLAHCFSTKGKALSRAIRRAGFDAIVTTAMYRGKPVDTREIVDLTMF